MNDLTVIKKDGSSVTCDHIQIDGNRLLLMEGNGEEREEIGKVHIEGIEIIESYYTDYNTIEHFKSGRNQE